MKTLTREELERIRTALEMADLFVTKRMDWAMLSFVDEDNMPTTVHSEYLKWKESDRLCMESLALIQGVLAPSWERE